MKYLDIYRDSAYTDKWASVPINEINPSWVSIGSQSVTLGGKTYEYYDFSNGCLLNGISTPQAAPMISWAKNRFPDRTILYFKNGLRVTNVLESGSECRFETFFVDDYMLSLSGNNSSVSENDHPNLWAISFEENGKTFIGFNGFANVAGTSPDYFRPCCCFESSFWEDALRPPYDYGNGTDDGGGMGDGKIPHTDIPLSNTPSSIIPLGGRGLHAYRINSQAYGSLQGFLWGDSSTLAKSLWQKFNNKTHNPVSCIVGCFSLPETFMPTGSGNTGINLAGLYLSPISGTCVSVSGSIGFIDHEITFGAIVPPFGNFLDYSAVSCKIHVPFCGEMAISAEQIINSDLILRYRVDQMNGNIVAAVKANGCIIGELSGNCAYNVPVCGGDDGTLQRLGAITSGITQIAAGNPQGVMSAAESGLNAQYTTQLVNADLHGSTTACENRVPYLVWTYNGTAYSPDYMAANGVPCEFSGNLVAFSGGYGEFEIMTESPALELVYSVMGATESEKEEIAMLLRSGVFV